MRKLRELIWIIQVRPCPKPTKIKLDMKTNLETKVVTKHYLPETGLLIEDSLESSRCRFSGDSHAIGYSIWY